MRCAGPLGLINLPVANNATTPVPANGAGSTIWSTTTNSALTWNGTSWQQTGGVPFLAKRNLAINGNFVINQRRVTSSTTLAAGAYGHDMWRGGASGATYSFTSPSPDVTANITAGSLCTSIEAANVSGAPLTLAWSGTATGRFYQGAASGAPAYAASPIVFASPAAYAGAHMEFTGGTVTRVQAVEELTPSTYGRRLTVEELDLCRYYFQKLGGNGQTYEGLGIGNHIDTQNVRLFWPYVKPMRVQPTITYPALTAFATNSGGNVGGISAINIDHNTITGCLFYVTRSAAVSGSNGWGATFQDAGGGLAYMYASAELPAG